MPFPLETRALLRVENLRVSYQIGDRQVEALRGVDLLLRPGQTVGILGESGCGKSTLAGALLRTLPANAKCEGSVVFEGIDVLGLDERGLDEIRGKEIALIPQTPSLALNPVVCVGEQVSQVIRAHLPVTKREAREQALAMLNTVHLPEAERTYRSYPHQLSGGQQQRVAIAQALACRPSLVIADEPTAALDATLQIEILQLLRELNQNFGTAFLLITHDPALLAAVADRIAVMYAGRVIEDGEADKVLREPLHPYTSALLKLMHSGAGERQGDKRRLKVIPGGPPNPAELLSGCSFEPRCLERMEICRKATPRATAWQGRNVSCFEYE